MCAEVLELPKVYNSNWKSTGTLYTTPLQHKLVCPATRLTSLDITEATQQKLVEKNLSPFPVIAGCEAIHGESELQTCDYQCVTSCSPQKKKESEKAKASNLKLR